MVKGVHLTLLIGPTVAVPAPPAVLDALESAQVTVAAGQRSGFQLVFGLSKNSLLQRVLLPAGYFDPKIRVILVATMAGLPDVLIDGVITRQELAAASEPGQSRLTVTGEDVSLVMDLREETGRLFPATTRDVRVRLILAKYAQYGLLPAVIPSIFPDVPNPVEREPAQQGTDLGYIKKLADEAGYVFYVEPGPAPGANVAYWGPEVRIGVPQPALNVNLDGWTNVDSMSFSLDGLSRTQPTVTIQEPLTKLPIPIPVPDVSLLRPPLSLRPAPALRTAPLTAARYGTVEAALLGLKEAGKSSDAINASGQLNVLRYGRILKARRLVGVRGAGLAYDGLYYVRSVTHNLKHGEYTQSFSLTRDGLVSNTPRVVT